MSYRDEDESSVYGFTFNRKKVKYALLNSLFEESILDTSVTLFIDMKYILDIMRIKYYAEMVERELVKDSNRVIAEVLNFVVHYKRYFVDKRGCSLHTVLLFEDGGVPDRHKNAIDTSYDQARIEKTIKAKFLGYLGNKMQRFASCIPNLYVLNGSEDDFNTIETSVLPWVVREHYEGKVSKSAYNVFISNDPLIQQYSQKFKGFFHLQPAGDNSRMIATNGYFAYLYEKHKYAVKSPEELKTHDRFIPLYLNLVGEGVASPIENFKSKKAIDLINKVKKNHTLFNDYGVLAEFGVSPESILKMQSRHALFDVFAHANLLQDSDILRIQRQLDAANKVNRADFDHYNYTAFGNRVEAPTLFL